MGISKLLVYTMAACGIIKAFLKCLLYLWVFYIAIIALIIYKERGALISSTHSKIHMELRTTHYI